MTEILTRHLTIRGRVQGVGFRKYVAYKAGELGVRGWVRNRIDGSVEAMVQGAPAAVTAIIECAHRGPRAAEVSSVVVVCEESSVDYATFETRPTA
jgi:acylphosphatase